jgi:L-ribulose-5-phosphate 4-epimerase
MMLKALREEVLDANFELVRRNLVVDTFGNASGIKRSEGLVVIKPSGVPYDKMTAADLVVTDLEGKIVEGKLRPSSDLPTHLEIYRAFAEVGGVAHTHSRAATPWAQAGREIPCYGTTHADYFHGSIPVTPHLTHEEIGGAYELNTGRAIVRHFKGRDPMAMRAVLVAGHAPFCWGATAAEAAHTAWMLEEIAQMAISTLLIDANASAIPDSLRDKHFLRKHGANAYYGQADAKRSGR